MLHFLGKNILHVSQQSMFIVQTDGEGLTRKELENPTIE